LRPAPAAPIGQRLGKFEDLPGKLHFLLSKMRPKML
jgi:hypothetical protein